MSLTIKELSEADRPREKLLYRGARALTDAELIAILIGSGSHHMSAVELAQTILKGFDHKLESLLRNASVDELCRHKGMGTAKAVTLMAALELGRRLPVHQSHTRERPSITSSSDAHTYMRPKFPMENICEEMWMLLLDRRKHPINMYCVSRGGQNRTIVDVREVFRLALQAAADTIILAHNHPSGDVTPSREDVQLTHQIAHAGKIMDIALVDHLIIGTGATYFSFADAGQMPQL